MLTLRTEGHYGAKIEDSELLDAAILRGSSRVETQRSCETERHMYFLYLCCDRIFWRDTRGLLTTGLACTEHQHSTLGYGQTTLNITTCTFSENFPLYCVYLLWNVWVVSVRWMTISCEANFTEKKENINLQSAGVAQSQIVCLHSEPITSNTTTSQT